MSQGWCSALGVAVPTPLFLQEYLIGSFEDPKRSFRHIGSLTRILLTLEVSENDRNFHEDIMGEEGKWWLSEDSEPLAYTTIVRLFDERTKQVCTICCEPSFILLQMLECGVWDPNVWHIPRESDIRAPEPQPWVPLRSQAEKDELTALADTLHLSERILEETAIDKLDHFNQLTKAQAQIERLVDIETERVESSKWNHDAAVQLILLTQSGKRIPFGTRLDLFDLNPTASH